MARLIKQPIFIAKLAPRKSSLQLFEKGGTGTFVESFPRGLGYLSGASPLFQRTVSPLRPGRLAIHSDHRRCGATWWKAADQLPRSFRKKQCSARNHANG